MALTSYGFMYGTLSFPWWDRVNPEYDPYGEINGTFNDRQRITTASIVDGLSNTAFATETARGYFNQRPTTFTSGRWTATVDSSTLFYATWPPNAGFRFKSPLITVASFHVGGVNVLLGDGSVRFVKETVNSWPLNPDLNRPIGVVQVADGYLDVPPPGVWQALTTRAGGEVIGDF